MIGLLEKNRWLAIILTILIAIEIFYFSTLQGSVGTGGNVWPARIYHFTVFFLFAFFLLMGIKGNKKIKSKYILSVLIISVLYAISDEIHQIFVPLRDASIRDILIDSLGIFCAMGIAWFTNKKSTSQT